MDGHRYVGIESFPRQGVVAVCSCGWRSGRYPSAGMAGSAWDEHVEAMAAEEASG